MLFLTAKRKSRVACPRDLRFAVKKFVPNTHPNALPSALERVKFNNVTSGSQRP